MFISSIYGCVFDTILGLLRLKCTKTGVLAEKKTACFFTKSKHHSACLIQYWGYCDSNAHKNRRFTIKNNMLFMKSKHHPVSRVCRKWRFYTVPVVEQMHKPTFSHKCTDLVFIVIAQKMSGTDTRGKIWTFLQDTFPRTRQNTCLHNMLQCSLLYIIQCYEFAW